MTSTPTIDAGALTNAATTASHAPSINITPPASGTPQVAGLMPAAAGWGGPPSP